MGRRLYNEHFEFDRWSEDVGKFSVGSSQGNYHTGAIINILRAEKPESALVSREEELRVARDSFMICLC